MAKNIKLRYMTDDDPITYDTICPKTRVNKASFDNTNTVTSTWGGYTLHHPLSATNALAAFEETQAGISVYGKVVSTLSWISGDVVGMVGYGNMAIYVGTTSTNVLNVYNVKTATSSTITLPDIGGTTPVIKDIAMVKVDNQTPEIGLLCYVGSAVYYVSYDVLSRNTLNTGVSYTQVSMLTGTSSISRSSRFLRTKKELVIINGSVGYTDSTYGDMGKVMRSTNLVDFYELTKLDGATDSVYLPLSGAMYCGDDLYSAPIVSGANVMYKPLIFTIDLISGNDAGLNIHKQYTTNVFNPLGRDLNTGRMMFSTDGTWWELDDSDEVVKVADFLSAKTPTAMICVNGMKITNAGYYYNADGLTTGMTLKTTANVSISPSSSQSYLRLFRINDSTLIIYAPSTGVWYQTTLFTSL